MADTDAHVQALIAALVGAVFDADEEGAGRTVPYVLVHDLGDRGDRDEDPTLRVDGDTVLLIQIRAVSDNERGARDLRDQTRPVVAALTVPGRQVTPRREQAFGAKPNSAVEPPRWDASDRWAIWSTPTS